MTQKEFILNWLKSAPMTTLVAGANGITRLAARIGELEQDGHKIDRKMITVFSRWGKTRVTEYRLGG